VRSGRGFAGSSRWRWAFGVLGVGPGRWSATTSMFVAAESTPPTRRAGPARSPAPIAAAALPTAAARRRRFELLRLKLRRPNRRRVRRQRFKRWRFKRRRFERRRFRGRRFERRQKRSRTRKRRRRRSRPLRNLSPRPRLRSDPPQRSDPPLPRSRRRRPDPTSRRTEAIDVGLRSPAEVCGGRNFITRAICVSRQCQAAGSRLHPECAEARRIEEQRQRRMDR
jgi:hypothetical protein